MMLQAEIAGRLVPSPEGYPTKGSVIRDFQLPSAEGMSVLLSDYRGRSNMVLVLAGESDLAGKVLSDLAQHRAVLNENETRTLAIVAGPPERAAKLKRSLHLNLELLADAHLQLHRAMGTTDQAGHILPALFITDRFGEVFAAFRMAQAANLPSIEEIQGWIDHINRQCPECGPPEWLG
jgi:peroxiredoxin